jgi:parvulin-like peptidyl-prolyl isomerase
MEKEIQDTFGTKERFQRYLSVMKLSAKEYREFVRQKLMARALVQRRTQADSPVASRELVEYYEAHKSEFMEGGACELWGIYVPKTWQRAESPVTLIRSLAEELKQAPKEFEAKAKAHSVGPGAAEGGYWGWKDLKSLSEPLRRACETLTKDGISGVIETEAGYFVLKMGESKPGQLQSFESAQTAIQEKIVRQRFSDQRKKLIQDLKDKGYVFVTKSMDDHWLR